MLEPADQTALENLYTAVAVDDPTLAASTALHFILDSPRFLFTVEFGTPEATLSRLSPSEVWRSVPDAALLAAADGGGLADEAGVREQATRLFQDPKAQPVLKAFVEQWLGLGSTGTDASAQAVDAEAGAVFGALAQGTGTYGDLFTSTMSRGSQDLAATARWRSGRSARDCSSAAASCARTSRAISARRRSAAKSCARR